MGKSSPITDWRDPNEDFCSSGAAASAEAFMERPLLFLVLAIGCEVLWAVMLKVSQGFAVLWASLVMVVAYVLSLICLNLACKHFDVSIAYAVWTGSGATLVALIGIFVFREPLGLGRALGLVLVIAGVVVLLGFETHARKEKERTLAPNASVPAIDVGSRLAERRAALAPAVDVESGTLQRRAEFVRRLRRHAERCRTRSRLVREVARKPAEPARVGGGSHAVRS